MGIFDFFAKSKKERGQRFHLILKYWIPVCTGMTIEEKEEGLIN